MNVEVSIFSCKNRLQIWFQRPKVQLSFQTWVPNRQAYETSERHDTSRGNAAGPRHWGATGTESQETQTAGQMSVQQMAGEERQLVQKTKIPNLKFLKFVFSSAFVEKAAVFPPTSVRGAQISRETAGEHESWRT